jgi:RNase P/RNase MRP subunit p30
MQIINTSNLNEARKQIQKLKKENKQIIVRAQDEEFNRKILETREINIFLAPETIEKKDSLRQRNSGLNEVLCKIATKNNTSIGIDLNYLKKQDKKQKAIILSKIIQNISLCKRAKTNIIIFPRQLKKQELASFLSVLKF